LEREDLIGIVTIILVLSLIVVHRGSACNTTGRAYSTVRDTYAAYFSEMVDSDKFATCLRLKSNTGFDTWLEDHFE
jgi:hypothetical protein